MSIALVANPGKKKRIIKKNKSNKSKGIKLMKIRKTRKTPRKISLSKLIGKNPKRRTTKRRTVKRNPLYSKSLLKSLSKIGGKLPRKPRRKTYSSKSTSVIPREFLTSLSKFGGKLPRKARPSITTGLYAKEGKKYTSVGKIHYRSTRKPHFYKPIINKNPAGGFNFKELGTTSAKLAGFSAVGILIANVVKNKLMPKLPDVMQKPNLLRAATILIVGTGGAYLLSKKMGHKDLAEKIQIGSIAIGSYILVSRGIEILTASGKLPAIVSGLVGDVNTDDMLRSSNQNVSRLINTGTPLGLAARNFPDETQSVSRLITNGIGDMTGVRTLGN